MSRRLIVMTILIAVPCMGSEQPDVSHLLDQYARNADQVSSFIMKSEGVAQARYFFSREPGKPQDRIVYTAEEVRYDGERTSYRGHWWGNMGFNDAWLDRQEASYKSRLWDGKNFYQYDRGVHTALPKGRLYLNRNDQANEAFDRGETTIGVYQGVNSLGRFPGDYERIDAVLRKAGQASVRTARETVGDSSCYVIDAAGPGGTYTVWLDPDRGYNVARIEIHRAPGNHDGRRVLKQGQEITYSWECTAFKQVGEAWIPAETKVSSREHYGPEDYYVGESQLKIADVTLDPDHDALGSFQPDDIENGARVYLVGMYGIHYSWQDGELIPNVDRVSVEMLDKLTDEILRDDDGVPPVEETEVMTPQAILERYVESQKYLQSFIAKGQSRIVREEKTGPPHDVEEQTCEFRFDGDKVCHRACSWDDAAGTKEQAEYASFLWDGESFVEYQRGLDPGSDKVVVRQGDAIKNRMISTHYRGAPLTGICGGDYEKVDSILGRADRLTLATERERVQGSDCHVLEATTPRGTYKVWIDPEHGYNIARMEVCRRKGDIFNYLDHVQGEARFLLSNVRFESVYGIWAPMEADMEQTDDTQTARWHHKRTSILLNPDHEKLRSFAPDDIQEGAPVVILGAAESAAVWKDGQPVSETKSDETR